MSGSVIRTNIVREVGFIQGVAHTETVSGNNLPTVFPPLTNDVFLDIDLTGDIDVTSWAPTGMLPGTIVRLRNHNGGGVIKYSENGIDYSYAGKKGEIITLKWYSNTGFKII